MIELKKLTIFELFKVSKKGIILFGQKKSLEKIKLTGMKGPGTADSYVWYISTCGLFFQNMAICGWGWKSGYM